ncbi:hypothetical protein [Lichenicoccus sp.]|uniref:hypothetical protein n=1 Tax=Lichenicoccus sp. TaxID=2781899 RepID=UPI003D13EEA6
MIRGATLAPLLVGTLLAPLPAAAQISALNAPGTYSLAPSGEASLTYGSRNFSAASLAMRSGPIGDTGVHGFVGLSTASGEGLPAQVGTPKARITEQDGTLGLQKSFADGTTISVSGGWSHASGPVGRYLP